MEHNFNPNKGDYKYILKEELRKETGESTTTPASLNKKNISRLQNRVVSLIQKLFKRKNSINISFTLFLEMFY